MRTNVQFSGPGNCSRGPMCESRGAARHPTCQRVRRRPVTREATAWTLPLRWTTVAYLVLVAVVALVTNAAFNTRPAIERSLRAASPQLAGDQLQQSVTV